MACVRRLLSALVLVLLASLALGSCSSDGGGGGGSPSEPGGFAITVNATPQAIGPTGQTEIGLRVTSTGASVAGLVITLTTNLGVLDVAEVTTDAQGRATAHLRGNGATGTARVTAQLRTSGASGATDVRVGLDPVLTVTVQPSAIAGSQSAAVTVALVQPGGTPGPSGTGISLVTTLGRLASTQLSLDSTGTARTTLFADGAVGTATITAVASSGGSASTNVTLRPAYELSLSANPTAISTSQKSTLTVRVIALDPSASVANLNVGLSTTLGRLDTTSVRTSSSGVATTGLSASGTPGTATVAASLAGAAPVSTTVAIGTTARLTLSVLPNRLSAANGTATVTVQVFDPDGSPATGQQVRLATSRGRLDQDSLVASSSGVATTVLRGTGERGTATVIASLPGTSVSVSVTVTFT